MVLASLPADKIGLDLEAVSASCSVNVRGEKRIVTHDLSGIRTAKVLKASENRDWKNISMNRVSVQRGRMSAPGIDSFSVFMAVGDDVHGTVRMGDASRGINLVPGAIFILSPGKAIEMENFSPAEFLNIYISPEMVDEVSVDFCKEGRFTFNIEFADYVVDDFLQGVILSMKDVLDTNGRFSAIEIEYLARTLIARIIAKHSLVSTVELGNEYALPAPVLRKALDYIDRNLNRRIELERMALEAGFGSAHFGRLFKRATNVTLHQYIIRRRVDRARQLLLETNMPIVEIAHECGFSDQVHLTRCFGRFVNMSPASFRRAGRK